MSLLLLGLRGIPLAEAALIRTIVRLSSSLSPAWEVIDDGDCHLLIHDGPAAPAVAGRRSIALAARGAAPQAGTLQRPIRAEELVEFLNREGAQLAPTPPVQPAPPAAPAAGRGAVVEAAARLKQWPSWQVLKGRPHALQLATHLSRAPYSAGRLALASQAPLAQCLAFMQELDALGLLVWQAEQSAPPVAAAAPRRGLLHSIRRRLRGA